MDDAAFFSNLRSWSAHIDKFITDTEIAKYCYILLQKHTFINSYNEIKCLRFWSDTDMCTQNGVALFYKE